MKIKLRSIMDNIHLKPSRDSKMNSSGERNKLEMIKTVIIKIQNHTVCARSANGMHSDG